MSKFETANVPPRDTANGVALNTKLSLEADFTSSDIKGFFQANVGAIDHDNDGFLSVDELDQFKPRTEKERRAAGFLRQNFDNVVGLSNDQWGFENKISVADIDQFEVVESKDYAEMNRQVKAIVGTFERNFAGLDRDRNGAVSLNELEAADKGRMDVGARQMVDFMIKGYSEFSKEQEGISRSAASDIAMSFDRKAAHNSNAISTALLGTVMVPIGLGSSVLALSGFAMPVTSPLAVIAVGGGLAMAATPFATYCRNERASDASRLRSYEVLKGLNADRAAAAKREDSNWPRVKLNR